MNRSLLGTLNVFNVIVLVIDQIFCIHFDGGQIFIVAEISQQNSFFADQKGGGIEGLDGSQPVRVKWEIPVLKDPLLIERSAVIELEYAARIVQLIIDHVASAWCLILQKRHNRVQIATVFEI